VFGIGPVPGMWLAMAGRSPGAYPASPGGSATYLLLTFFSYN
jgi:hypothetical protein